MSTTTAAKMLEIRWHGRGGQGAKTASLLLAQAAFEIGAYMQAFPEYGPERMGAPVTAYTRISNEPIRIHSNIYEPDVEVVIDPTLIGIVDVTSGLKEDGILLVNTPKDPEYVKEKTGFKGKVYTIDASQIALDEIGGNFPNTPMLAAVVKVTGILDEQKFVENMEGNFRKKFAHKLQVVDGNMRALKRAMQEVKGL
ncbi:MAG: 2-oxoacid:acceptor oxidoreductase family protein [Thermoanaerobacteraceae bacterium]|nr:2-oxoacid:acceptor oxidoreductase family protein [Thermoanaerobacteraceae bacterium]